MGLLFAAELHPEISFPGVCFQFNQTFFFKTVSGDGVAGPHYDANSTIQVAD